MSKTPLQKAGGAGGASKRPRAGVLLLLLCAGLAVGAARVLLPQRHQADRSAETNSHPSVIITSPGGGAGASVSPSAYGSLDQETLLTLALSDPEKYLASLEHLTGTLFEKGVADPAEITACLRPSLRAALKTLWERDAGRALQALELIRFSPP